MTTKQCNVVIHGQGYHLTPDKKNVFLQTAVKMQYDLREEMPKCMGKTDNGTHLCYILSTSVRCAKY